jgi:uncharacterized membrane protein SpoIIM required for sporulation
MRNKVFLWFCIASFFCWLLPFVVRIFFIDFTEINIEQAENQHHTINIMDKITLSISKNDKYETFTLIFINNLKGCILNIVGGVMLGLVTLINLIYNGFFSADIFVNSYKAGISIESILKVTLPHSFELIALWLSGAVGFYIAWEIIQFMRGKEKFTSPFYKNVGIYSLIIFVIILSAAYVETYISTSIK